MFCEKCGSRLNEGDAFCPMCGNPVATFMTESTLSGNSVPKETQRYVPETQQRQKPQKVKKQKVKKQKMDLKILALLVALILLAVGLLTAAILLRPASPEKVINKLEASLNKMDIDDAMKCFDQETRASYEEALDDSAGSFTYGQALGVFSFVAGLYHDTDLLPKFTLTVRDVRYVEERTCYLQVEYSISYEGEIDEGEEEIKMVKENQKWVISGNELDLF